MRHFSFAILSLVVGISCSTKETITTPALGYEPKTFKLTSRAGCDDDSTCSVFQVTYPVFSGIDSTVAYKIQREIDLSFSLGDPDAERKSLEEEAKEFIDEYKSFVKEVPAMNVPWYFNGEARVNVLLDSLISISIDEEYYTGGAHGGNGKFFINMDPRTGDKVTLSSILKPGFESALTRAGEAAFRLERELKPTDDFLASGFEFPDNTFQLNDNYGFTNEGIIFYYNAYEIGPYAAGPTEVFVSFKDLLNWLRVKPVQERST